MVWRSSAPWWRPRRSFGRGREGKQIELKDAVKVLLVFEAVDDEIEEAAVGDEVPIPDIKGLKASGRKGRLKMTFVVEE